jgi:hypothetical protein
MAIQVVGSKQPQFASEQLKPNQHGFGQNGWGGASSLLPGQIAERDFDISPIDPALEKVKAAGSATVRPVNEVDLSQGMARSNVPVHCSMRNPNSNNPKVPGSLADNEGRAVRRASGER